MWLQLARWSTFCLRAFGTDSSLPFACPAFKSACILSLALLPSCSGDLWMEDVVKNFKMLSRFLSFAFAREGMYRHEEQCAGNACVQCDGGCIQARMQKTMRSVLPVNPLHETVVGQLQGSCSADCCRIAVFYPCSICTVSICVLAPRGASCVCH